MPEEEMKELTQQELGDIILCEPITSRGLVSLEQLGLMSVVTEDCFYNKMYIAPKYTKESFIESYVDKNMEHAYSVSSDRFEEKRAKLEEFEKKLTSDAQFQSPLLIIGTAGNGKSIEVNYKIREPKRNNEAIPCNRILYNLEKSLTELTYVSTFRLEENQENDSLWLICMALLNGLYKLIEKHSNDIPTIVQNHQEIFIKHHSANDIERHFFLSIGNFEPNEPNTVKQLFEAIIKMVNKKSVERSIENLLKMTMNIMYCINPKNKNYIVFDNLEHYIKLNERKIPIYNETLSKFYEVTKKVTGNLTETYDRICLNESWRAFKIIIVLRRISAHFLVKSDVAYASKILSVGNDYNGHFDIWNIWKEKKENIWEKYLKNKYDPKQSSVIISILNNMMDDKPGVLGSCYQELISALMNGGIRRNGRAQAYAAMQIYKILHRKKACYINYEIYNKLVLDTSFEKTDKVATVTRYIYRRALLQIQLKWMMISETSQARFNNLLLGKLSDEEKPSGFKDRLGEHIMKRKVILNEPNVPHVTFVRRVLSYLYNCKDNNTEMFGTKSLYDLMAGIFLNPIGNTKILDIGDEFFSLAKILNSLGNLSNDATKTAPFVILDIRDPRIELDHPDIMLSNILEEIWNAGAKESKSGKRYGIAKYGIRLTEAGSAFLCDVQPSFSFFAALYCSEEVPLFFLVDPERIKYVIRTIYNAANTLCEKYELAARSFCGTGVVLFKKEYLPKHKGGYKTFKSRVKELHVRHLELYNDYIDKNSIIIGINDDDKKILREYIEKYIMNYKEWKTTKEENAVCF